MDVQQSSPLTPEEQVYAGAPDAARSAQGVKFPQLFAVAIGVLGAVLVARIGSAHNASSNGTRAQAGRADFDSSSSASTASRSSSISLNASSSDSSSNTSSSLASSSTASSATHSAGSQDSSQLDGMNPQKQAENLLELAIGQSNGAVEQISSRVDRWQGRLKWNSQIATLTTAALNSNDMRVRESAVEIELAAYGLGKDSASLDYLLKTVDSKDHAQKIWALWALGLMGNRGVESEQVVQVLTAHLRDSDEESRLWAVEGLALVGTIQTIDPLLKTMHDDASPRVREGAACGLAQSGMLTPDQRMAAVPQLLKYTDDPALDAQTHQWTFLALGEITRQRLPNDAAAWREWYGSAVVNR
jgi:HEAT repeat protein